MATEGATGDGAKAEATKVVEAAEAARVVAEEQAASVAEVPAAVGEG